MAKNKHEAGEAQELSSHEGQRGVQNKIWPGIPAALLGLRGCG